MERLGIRRPHHPLIRRPHVQNLRLLIASFQRRRRTKDAGAGGGRLHSLQEQLVPVARLTAAGGADEPAIAVGRPRGDSAKRAAGGPLAGAIALEGESEDAAVHLLGEELRGEGEVDEDVRAGGGARGLQAEGDVAAAPAEEGADEHGVGAAGRIDDVGEVGGRRRGRRRRWWGDERGPVWDGGDSVAGEEASKGSGKGAEQLHGSCYLLQ